MNQLGKQAETQGGILIEEAWYCPSMPQPLIDATKDLYGERIDRDAWTRLIAARKAYRLMPKENEDPEGHQRVMCPARAGKSQGPVKLRTLNRGIDLPLVDLNPAPSDRSRSAASAASRRPGRRRLAGPRFRGLRMTEDLLPAPQRRRGLQGLQRLREEPLTKASKRPALAASAASPPRPSCTVLLVFQLAHADRRKIKNEVETLALDGQRPRRRTHHRRRTKPIGSWTPTG
ncbi:hypothetical protein [Streptomyces sp. NPDC048425]|uniref:hypothetical protein n=1 Tax=Streptomyces sp. NPDC048425 TaxID=3365548 RepID=UPI003711EB19